LFLNSSGGQKPARTWVEDGATSYEHAAALLKSQEPPIPPLGHQVRARVARIKIEGLRLVGGQPDFTNTPAHADKVRVI